MFSVFLSSVSLSPSLTTYLFIAAEVKGHSERPVAAAATSHKAQGGHVIKVKGSN